MTTGSPADGEPATGTGTTAPPPHWRYARLRLVLISVAYAGLVLFFTVWGFCDMQSSAGDSPAAAIAAPTTGASPTPAPASAAPSPAPSPAPAPACRAGAAPAAGTKSATLAPLGTPVESIAFGRSLKPQEREFEFTITDPAGALAGATCLPVHVNPFLRTDAGPSAELDRSRIDAAVSVDGPQVRLTLTIQRTDVAFAPPGSYTGTISIIDPRIERVNIPLTVSMAYPIWQLPLVALLLVLPVALINLWLVKGSFSTRQAPVTAEEFDDYVFSRNGVLAVGAGVAAAVLVFSTTYLSSLTWGTSFVDVFSLFGGAFFAFTAAATPVTAAGVDTSDRLSRTGGKGGGTGPVSAPAPEPGPPGAGAGAADPP